MQGGGLQKECDQRHLCERFSRKAWAMDTPYLYNLPICTRGVLHQPRLLRGQLGDQYATLRALEASNYGDGRHRAHPRHHADFCGDDGGCNRGAVGRLWRGGALRGHGVRGRAFPGRERRQGACGVGQGRRGGRERRLLLGLYCRRDDNGARGVPHCGWCRTW